MARSVGRWRDSWIGINSWNGTSSTPNQKFFVDAVRFATGPIFQRGSVAMDAE